MKTLLGIVSYGNLDFLKLAVGEALATATAPLDLAVVVAKPGDTAMVQWLRREPRIQVIVNSYNQGFCGSLNDLCDLAFVGGAGDGLIVMGNDVVPYPGAIDALIEAAATTDRELISASQLDVRELVGRYPEAARYFSGPSLDFTDFSARPWDLHLAAVRALQPELGPRPEADVQNLCLITRRGFQRLGYFDVNYFANGYFSDNDYCRCAALAGVAGGVLAHAVYYHAWSRTLHQGEAREHDRFFRQNEAYYRVKWGGPVGGEKYTIPFNGRRLKVADGLVWVPSLKIETRAQEAAAVAFWSGGGVLGGRGD